MNENITKQKFHLEPPYGLLNDPNGLTFYKGKLYVFFQWNRLAKDHSYKEWGLFTSEDLKSFKFQGTALVPDQVYDFKGIYSGSGLVIDDCLYLFYTGNTNIAGHRRVHQSLAITKDGKNFLKSGPVLDTPKGFTEHFRDPKVFKDKNGKYLMVIGAQIENGKGAVVLCESKDALSFHFKSILGKSEDFQMVECPDLFQLDSQFILTYCLQSRDNRMDKDTGGFSCYKITNFNSQKGELSDSNLDQDYQLMDFGFDFYAPQSTCLPDGRRVMFAWMSRMSCEEEKSFDPSSPRIHCLTIPRELSIKNNKLHQKPLTELYELFSKPEEITSNAKLPTHHFLLESDNIQNDFIIKINDNETIIEYCNHKLLLKRINWHSKQIETRELNDLQIHKIEIWVDTSSIEIFINDGEYTLSSRIFPKSNHSRLEIDGNNQFKIRKFIGV